MRYSALHNFYKVDETALYASPLDFKIMSNTKLNAIVTAGFVASEKEIERQRLLARQKDQAGQFKSVMAVIAVVTAGVALAASGTVAAAAPGVNAATGSVTATGAGSATAASTAAAGSTGASGVWAQVKTVAEYVGKISTIAGQVTGSDDANRLAATANLMSSPTWGDAIKQGTEFVLKNEGLKIDPNNEDAKAAANELIRREQEAYAAKLRQMAEIEAQKTRVDIKQPEPLSIRDIAPYAVPVILTLIGLS